MKCQVFYKINSKMISNIYICFSRNKYYFFPGWFFLKKTSSKLRNKYFRQD